MSLDELHCRIALSTLFYALALFAWAAMIFVFARRVTSSLFGALVIGEFLLIAEGALGLILLLSGARPADLLHLLYGVLSVIAWPVGYAYAQAGTNRRSAGIYAIASILVFALAVRAMMTGPGSVGPSCLPRP